MKTHAINAEFIQESDIMGMQPGVPPGGKECKRQAAARSTDAMGQCMSPVKEPADCDEA